MANYNQVGYGSKGSDVTELQKLLNQNGYSLDLDGQFGPKTLAAVKEYQQKNGLSVDGIVGKNTWGALTSAQNAGSTGSTPSKPSASEMKFEDKGYAESDIVKQAQSMLQQHMANKHGAYQSPWQAQLNDIINKINNREKFSYDLNGDALYQQYKDQYTTQGKMAMMDTMGQAAAMTGGYGNSYAQTVGQQAYQGYLQGLNDKVPELYQLALSKYNAEGDEMYNQAALMAQMESQDYGRYRDQVSDYYTELDRLYNQYNAERDYDYGKYTDDRNFSYGQFSDDRNLAYQTERDKVADQQWQAQFDEAKRQYDQQYALSRAKAYAPTPKPVDEDDDEPEEPEVGFTGSTYSEAAAFLKSNGYATSGLMSNSEWTRHKNGKNSAGGEHEASSYKEYLAAYIYGLMNPDQ